MKQLEGISITQRHLGIICYAVCLSLCISININVGLFVYGTMSFTLIGGILILTTATVSLIHFIVCKGQIPDKMAMALLIVWGAYLLCHAFFIANPEQYKFIYIEESIIAIVALSYQVRNGLMDLRKLDNGIMLMLLIQIVYLCFQAIGIIPSGSTFFALTGSNDNPNCTAMLIVVSLPTVFKRLKTSNYAWIYLLLSVLSVVFLIALKCRTTYVGLITIIAVRAIFEKKLTHRLFAMSRTAKFVFSFLVVSAMVVVAVTMYQKKQDSSDGRLLIWKISATMIAQNPQGHGIGMFEREYNLSQGHYFANESGTANERRLASTVYMAYNDFIEQGVESGVIGMAFLMAFYIMVIVKAYQDKMYGHMALILAFSIMSCVNFAYATMQAWMAVACISAFVIGHSGESLNSAIKRNRSGIFIRFSISIILGAGVACLSAKHLKMTLSQIKLANIEQRFHHTSDNPLNELCKLKEDIGTSEAYWTFLSSMYYRQCKYQQSLECAQKASLYTSVPDVFFRIYNCYDMLDQTEKGIPYIEIVKSMIPQNIKSRLILMRWYDRIGQKETAICIAKEIINMDVKVASETADRIRNEAIYFLHHENIN